MLKQISYGKLKLLDNKKVVNFGYGVYNAAMNMAIDEALFLKTIETGGYFLRFYDFDKPSVILAVSDHPDSINNAGIGNIGISRRKSGGDPIYLDDVGTFSYSICGRFDSEHSFGFEFKEFVHANLGNIVADSIKSIVSETNSVDIGKHNSVRLNGMPIAGHAQKLEKNSAFLYQGVLAIDNWNADRIRNALRICDEDYDALKHLPSIRQAAKNSRKSSHDYKIEFMKAMLDRISDATEITEVDNSEKLKIMEMSNHLFEKDYSNPEWVFAKNQNLKIRSKFCLCNYDF